MIMDLGYMALLYNMTSYYALRADSADGDFRCGIYMIYLAVNGLNKGWGTGAALSFILHIILIVVVVLALVPIVVCSLLMGVLLFLVLAGLLALLYCSSYYTYRGGVSSHGTGCGAFFVSASIGAGHANWYVGAALYYCFILSSSWRNFW